MSIVQIIVIAVICLVRPRPGGIVLPDTARDWLLGASTWRLFAGAFALVGQTWAQAHLAADPERDHHEHGAGLRGAVRRAASAARTRPRGCCSAARWC